MRVLGLVAATVAVVEGRAERALYETIVVMIPGYLVKVRCLVVSLYLRERQLSNVLPAVFPDYNQY